ncbi:hypothetical protein SLS58_006899 [Diplodia intermedia]|uniref:F-box domain-containing protein n=1 Tax=Diplodia intermedia TaxID=856260 RepID=A0ABR3TLL7_9PEZI
MDANTFRFLDLPGEIRNRIYEMMLVRPKVNITARFIRARPTDIPFAGIPFKARRAFTYINNMDPRNMTYEATPKQGFRAFTNVFLVNRQVHREASSIFYSQNTFSFAPNVAGTRASNAPMATGAVNTTLSLGACAAFFHDRPASALARLQSLELFLMDGELEIGRRQRRPFGRHIHPTQVADLVAAINRHVPGALAHLSLRLGGAAPRHHRTLHPLCTALFRLRRVGSLAVRWEADARHDDGGGRSMVRWTAVLRRWLLQNAPPRATAANIRVTRRHLAVRTRGGVLWRRTADRVVVVECHDDARGRSLLPPPVRLAPLIRGASSRRVGRGGEEDLPLPVPRDFRFRAGSRVGPLQRELGDSDGEDWDLSDGGETDSLIEFDTGA